MANESPASVGSSRAWSAARRPTKPGRIRWATPPGS